MKSYEDQRPREESQEHHAAAHLPSEPAGRRAATCCRSTFWISGGDFACHGSSSGGSGLLFWPAISVAERQPSGVLREGSLMALSIREPCVYVFDARYGSLFIEPSGQQLFRDLSLSNLILNLLLPTLARQNYSSTHATWGACSIKAWTRSVQQFTRQCSSWFIKRHTRIHPAWLYDMRAIHSLF